MIRKDYPLIGVLKPVAPNARKRVYEKADQEGLPAYWGIETYLTYLFFCEEIC